MGNCKEDSEGVHVINNERRGTDIPWESERIEKLVLWKESWKRIGKDQWSQDSNESK